jgi:very-short-patch-repair endonuclease
MAFGPLANSGGERRLNVLISRARERCEVFSSIKADDIDLNRAKSRGAAALKVFLKYAEDGVLDIGRKTDREIDSEFEIQVKRFLESQGLAVDAQVGVAGFFVDLAVRDPKKPGRYLLGIECDGATYHSSRSARDRDRLREQVLIDRGWTIHRIWSPDWFKNTQEQMKRTLKAIENAKSGKARPKSNRAVKQSTPATLNADEDPDGNEEDHEPAEDPLMALVNPYREAELRARTDQPLHEVPVGGLAQIATNVVQVEGPIHFDEITRRIASFWGHQRISGKMSAAIKRAVTYAVRHGTLEARGNFYVVSGVSEIPVRNREGVVSVTLRNPEMLPPDEIRKAVLHIIGTHIGAGNDEIISVTSRLLGFRSTGPKVRQVIERVVNELVESGSIRERENRLYAV